MEQAHRDGNVRLDKPHDDDDDESPDRYINAAVSLISHFRYSELFTGSYRRTCLLTVGNVYV